jgi:hypothetical protein
MAKLALCFRGKKEHQPLTKDEINAVTLAAQGASAIIRVMAHYALDNPDIEADEGLGTYTSVFNVLEWLMEPVEGYLNNHAGYPSSER